MEKPVLYDYWRSSASYRVRIALNLLGIAYDAVAIDLLAKAHIAEEHRARNPQGLVPALAIDGQMLTQSLAIIEYLDETRSGAGLLAADPLGRARVRTLSYAIAMEIHPVCNLSVISDVMQRTGGGDAVRSDWMQTYIRKGLVAFEALLGDGKSGLFCHGDTPTMTSAWCRRSIMPNAGVRNCPTCRCSMQFATIAPGWRPSQPPILTKSVHHRRIRAFHDQMETFDGGKPVHSARRVAQRDVVHRASGAT